MRQLNQNRRGFALIAVLGVLAVVLVYLVTLQGSVGQTAAMDQAGRVRMERSEALAAMAAMLQPVATPTTLKVSDKQHLNYTAEVALRPVGAGDEIWRSLPSMSARPGDTLAEIRWVSGSAAGATDRVLINLQSRRHGLVRLDPPAAHSTSTTSPSAERQPL